MLLRWNGLHKTILLLALAVCAAFTALNFARMPRQIVATLPYLTCDEGSVMRAADSIVQNGYSGFRCHEMPFVSCYGGTQSFLDALSIKLVPEKIRNQGRLAEQPGGKWLWLGENSFDVAWLRFTRALYAAFALLFFFWAGKGLALPTRLLLTAAMGSSWSFVEAWLGMKNDYPSLFFLLLFVYFLRKFSQLPAEKRTIVYFLPVFLLGNLGIWVRIPMVVPVCLAALLFLSVHVQRGWKIHLVLRDSAILLFSTGALYFVLHPNIFQSSMEMRWMDPTLFIGRAPHISLWVRALEFRLMLFSCWPLFFVAAPLFQLARRRTWQFPERYMLYLLLATLAVDLLMLEKSQGRSHYYLAGTGLAFFLLQSTWQQFAPSRRALALFSLIALSSTLVSHLYLHRVHTRGFLMDTGPTDALTEEKQLADFLNGDAQKGKEIAVDNLLRPVIYEAAYANRKIIYFDSLSDSPEQLAQRLGNGAQLAVTCWAPKGEVPSDESYSPAREKWETFLTGKCADYQPATDRATMPFMGYFKTSKFVVLSAADLPDATGAQVLSRKSLNPRMLAGAVFGDDTFDVLLRLRGAKSLSGDLVSGITAQSVELAVNSACKTEGSVYLRLEVDGKVHETSVSTDSSEEFCREYPKACRWPWFRNWSQRRYPKNLSLQGLNIRPQSRVKIQVQRLDPRENGCPALMNMLRFK